MNTIKITMTGILFGLAILFASCGGLKIGLDEDTLDTLDCLVSAGCDDEESGDSEDSDSSEITSDEGDEDEDAGNTVTGDSYAGSSEDDTQTGGGFIISKPNGYEQTNDRYFMGTYENFHDESPDCADDYNFPNVVRAYSHNDDAFMDFETNTGSLVWIAKQYPDDTFDFSVRFLDLFGDPSVRLDCTCTITPAYYNYYNDRLGCSCEGDDGVCTLSYEKM